MGSIFIIKEYIMGRFIITEEERSSIRGLYLLEQETSGTTPNTQYMAAGTKVCFFGSCTQVKLLHQKDLRVLTLIHYIPKLLS